MTQYHCQLQPVEIKKMTFYCKSCCQKAIDVVFPNKIQTQNPAMQSGTILHLALLRKLSSRSPKSNYSKRFARFRTAMKQVAGPPSHHSAELFQKYPSVELRGSLMLRSSRSTLPLRVFKQCPTFAENDCNLNVCAWGIENQQDFDLLTKLKPTKNLTNDDRTKKVSQHARPKFTFCDEESKSYQRQPQKRDFGHSYRSRDDIKGIEIDSSFTQPSIKQKHTISQKENIVKGHFQCLLPSFRSRQGRKQPKQFAKNKKPLTELTITTDKQDF